MKTYFRKTISIILACLTISGVGAASMSVSAKDIVNKTENQLSISFDGEPITLTRGSSYTLPTITSKLIPGLSLGIKTDNNKVITVKNDVVTAVGIGKCTLTITLPNGKQIKQDINVALPEVNIRFTKPAITLGSGETAKLKALLSAANGNISWSSSNKNVISVDANGNITAKRTGTSVVTASANGKQTSCTITVKASPKKITFSQGKLTLGVGEKSVLDCKVNAGAAAFGIKYVSNDPKTVEVDKTTGKITAQKAGKAVITATTPNGKTATCTVFVKKAPTSITLNKAQITLKKGETAVLKAILPDGTSSGSITYIPFNDQIVKVSTNGLIKALKTGTSYILVKTYNGKTAYCRVTVTGA